MIKAKRCGGSKIRKIVCEDKISALPDDLLVKILDLVPTRNAVATMFLSKRWFHIWKMTHYLEYKDHEDDDYDDSDSDSDSSDGYFRDNTDDESKKLSIWWFLDKSLQLHKAPVIHSLFINLGGKCPIEANIEKWIEKTINKCTIHLELKLLRPGDPTSLPNSFYSCKSLTTLTLSHKILVDVPFSNSLPSLIDLELFYVMYKNNDSIVRFLSSCPNLEKLSVMRNYKDDNVTNFIVRMPNLLYFMYKSTNNLQINKNVGDIGMALVIDTPTLKEFDIITGDSCSFEMSCLDRAFIDLWYCPDEKSIRSLSMVLYLKLDLSDETVAIYLSICISLLVIWLLHLATHMLASINCRSGVAP